MKDNPIAKCKKNRSKKQEQKKKDIEFSKLVKARDGKCLYCGTTERLQCNHIISKKNMLYRYDMQNCITLCAGHHLWFWHRGNPLATALWLQTKYPEIYRWWYVQMQEMQKENG